MIEQVELSKDEICDKCYRVLKKGQSAFRHTTKNKYKHQVCPAVPDRKTNPKGLDLILVIETFGKIKDILAGAGFDVLKYEEDELVKLFWIYKQYLRDEKAPF